MSASLDSLRHVIAIKDSLLQIAATRAVHVTVPPSHMTLTTSRDWFDVLNLAMAVLASIVGAAVGAFISQRASLAAQREAHQLQRVEDKARLKHVTKVLLDKIASAALALSANDGSRPINLSALSDIEGTMAHFERVGDMVYLLRDPAYGELLEALLSRVKTMIGMARSAEEDIEAQLQRLNPAPYVNSPNLARWRAVSVSMRQPIIESIGRWKDHALPLMQELANQ